MSIAIERPLPHSADAERAILGAVVLDNSLVNQAIELLRPEDFYIRAHQFVFRAMTSLSERGGEINPILVGEELRREGTLEQTGGIAFISEMTYGLPHFTNVAAYAKVVKEHSLMRQLVRVANRITSDALEGDASAAMLLDRAHEYLAALGEKYTDSDAGPRLFSLTSFADFMRADFDDGEEIAFHARRGEIVLIQSVTNHGKSTLIRNAALSLAAGTAFPPVVEPGESRRVLLLNFEGSGSWFRNDIAVMIRDFTAPEKELIGRNSHPMHAPMIDGEPLSLSSHLHALEGAVRRAGGVDVLVIDTASAAFSLRNENDNAEVANYVMKPLMRLARKLNCLIVLVHHVGKAKAEEGAAREQAHRGRGASAWGDFCSSIFNLDADPHDKERVTITCGKRKDGSNYERVLRLDRERRWFKTTDELPAKPVTNADLVLKAMEVIGSREIRTAELVSALVGRVNKRTVMDCLNRLADAGKIENTARGWWAVVKVCADCATPYRDLHNCTNSDGEQKELLQMGLAVRASPPVNGNGFHKAGDNQEL